VGIPEHLENIERNQVPQVETILGDNHAIPPGKFDIILANITRNILLEGIPL